jgi:glycerol-3-phosphate dehydrogenase
MRREEMLARIQDPGSTWDFIIIGGGATGLGTALEAAARGYQALLMEQADFGQGTSSRSTKLIHGGVRYLQQGNIALVLEALKERGLLFQNAPHLVHNIPFVVPVYDWWESPFYGMGLKIYDMLAGKYGFGKSKILSKAKTLEYIPTVETKGLRGGVIYHDGQFDDARLAVHLARTAVEQGSTLINYFKALAFIKKKGFIQGVQARDLENDKEYELRAKVVINAGGVFADAVRKLDEPGAQAIIRPSQGAHIVLNKSFLPGSSAIMVPHTADGRVIFAIPWHARVVVGTTDTAVDQVTLEPRPFKEEIDFLLAQVAPFLTKDPGRQDILSAFAGLRPLISHGPQENTASISREHVVHISRSGLVTISGGKWTTYRKMAQDTVDQAAVLAQLDARPSVTHNLQIHGYHKNAGIFGVFEAYGSDAPALQDLLKEQKIYGQPLHPKLPYRQGEVIWAVRHEMARTAEDFLARRSRALVLDAEASLEAAPLVIGLMAGELQRNKTWEIAQLNAFQELAQGYLVRS